ncbi:jg6349 [Pararge aegeria aegeria]|uniref:Jg6349 protein n=1 Tax=Pararge aegeria aegeria TaxID=348720 RepID=A0A8S4RUD8_9NEOP|nr:jg6349 [Pararge aegeria aegeria]
MSKGKSVIRPIAFKPLGGRLSAGGERYGSTPVLASRPPSLMTLYGKWDKIEGLRHSKKFLGAIGACFPNKINRLSRRQVRYAIAAITGHFGTGSMLIKMGIIDDPTCRACNEDVESMEHLLCDCDVLARKRLDLLEVAYPQPEDYCASNLKGSLKLFRVSGIQGRGEHKRS